MEVLVGTEDLPRAKQQHGQWDWGNNVSKDICEIYLQYEMREKLYFKMMKMAEKYNFFFRMKTVQILAFFFLFTTPHVSRQAWHKNEFRNILLYVYMLMQAIYLILGNHYRSGCAVGAVVQVLIVGCIIIHIQRQNETAWEGSTQGVIHLRRKYVFSASTSQSLLRQKQLKHSCQVSTCCRCTTCLPHQELLQTCEGFGCCSSRLPGHHLKRTYPWLRSHPLHRRWSGGRLTVPWHGTWGSLPGM